MKQKRTLKLRTAHSFLYIGNELNFKALRSIIKRVLAKRAI